MVIFRGRLVSLTERQLPPSQKPPRKSPALKPKFVVSFRLARAALILGWISFILWVLTIDLSHFKSNNTPISDLSFFVHTKSGSEETPRPKDGRPYLNFDEAGLHEIPGLSRSHALPNAIPSRRKIPAEFAEDVQYHIAKRTNTTTLSITGTRRKRRPFYDNDEGLYNWNHSYFTDNRALYLYNPSIIPLHGKAGDPDLLSPKDLEELTGGDHSVEYLAIFRANTGGNCFGPDFQQLMKAGEQISYLAIALLDEDLNVVGNTDVLIDLNAGPVYGKYWRQFQEDCRVFSMRGSIYILCNERLLRVRIRRKPFVNATTRREQTTYTGQDLRCPYVFPLVYGNGLEITLLSRTKIGGGKNLNIFRALSSASNTKDGTTNTQSYDHYLQVYPLPHRYNQLDVPAPEEDRLTTTQNEKLSNASLPPNSFLGPDSSKTIMTCPENDTPGTWVTNCSFVEKPFFGDDDHGTTCCLEMSLAGVDVLVGVSHTKTSSILNPWWNRDVRGAYKNYKFGKQYLSRFVAYSRKPPFDIVARSGWFCMGHGSLGDNPLAGRNTQQRLQLFDVSYNCPSIHFISGLTNYLQDPSKAILSYGVNDCYPRFIVVEKKEIEQRLLGN